MKKIKFCILFALITCLLLQVAIDFSNAETNDIIVKITYPISHINYSMTNDWAGERNPWNKDYTRIMMWENSRTDISPRTYGRGLVWGYISKLKEVANGTQAQYEAAARPLFSKQSEYSNRAEWGIFENEENIIYALKKSTSQVVKINVDTGVETNIVSYAQAGYDVSNAKTMGWTTDNKLLVYFDILGSNAGGWEIDVQTGKKTFFTSWPSGCSDIRYNRYPEGPNVIHADKSLDSKHRVRYSASGSGDNGVYIADYTDPNCRTGDITTCATDLNKCPNYVDKNPYSITHVSWHANNNWFIGASVGIPYTYNQTIDNPPYMATFYIVQVIFNRDTKQITQKLLLSMSNAGCRKISYGDGFDNYQGGIPSPVLRLDGGQVLYTSTGEKYSTEDYVYCQRFPNQPICSTVNIASNRSGYRVYLADLAPSTNDTSAPAPPAIVDIK